MVIDVNPLMISANDYSGTDNERIQKAINDAESIGGTGDSGLIGGKVLIPAGKWYVENLQIKESIMLEGEGDGTILYGMDKNKSIISIHSGGAHYPTGKTTIQNMVLAYPNGAEYGVPTIYVAGSTDKTRQYNAFSKFNNLQILNASVGIHFYRAALWSVEGCNFGGFSMYGIHVENYANSDNGDQSIYGCCRFHGNLGSLASVFYESGGGLKIIGNKFYGNAKNSLWLHGEERADEGDKGSGGLNSWLVTGNSFEGTPETEHSILIQKVDSVINVGTITGNEIQHGICIDGNHPSDVRNILISSNNMVSSSNNRVPKSAIDIRGAMRITISSNHFAPSGSIDTGITIDKASSKEISVLSNAFFGFAEDKKVVGSVEPVWCKGDILIEGIYKAKGQAPGFWLEEIGGSGAYFVLNQDWFQVQRRALGFGAYETSPIFINIKAPSASLHIGETGHIVEEE